MSWGAKARPSARDYAGIWMLGDVGLEPVELLARGIRGWSHMEAEVAGSIVRLVDVVGQSGLGQAKENSFSCWLVKQAAGIEASQTSKATRPRPETS